MTGLVIICGISIYNHRVVKTTTVVNTRTEYNTTAGVFSAVSKMPTKTLSIIEEEIFLVAEEEPQWVEMDVPSNNSFKSYMDCSCITDETSEQYQLKFDYLSSASGIMLIEDRYVIALGSYYTTTIGTKVDLVMCNGAVVPCIVGDVKADCHTDTQNQQHSVDGSVVEFIVATDNLSDQVRLMGDISYADDRLMGEIMAIRIYLEN